MTAARLKLSTSLTLTAQEQGILGALTQQELSAFKFWQHALRARGIQCPSDRICVTRPTGGGTYCLEWHRKRLGPQAIAEGEKFRAFHEKKDQEFAARLQRRGKDVW